MTHHNDYYQSQLAYTKHLIHLHMVRKLLAQTPKVFSSIIEGTLMHNNKISSTVIIFWAWIIALISAISTTVFSESIFNDSFGISLIVFASLGLIINITYLCINTLTAICNPTH